MISPLFLSTLSSSRNLLAFSAGRDSSALFHTLLAHHIPFDIAIVNYNLRLESQEEQKWAQELAVQTGKVCYVKELLPPSSGIEAWAREERYRFFEEIIQKNGYTVLLTAHHLGDRLEWLLMQLTRGAGLAELLGFLPYEERKHYTLIRPFYNTAPEEITTFLNQNNIKWFFDSSNNSERYTRNRFRKNFSEPLLEEGKEGIKRTFSLLEKQWHELNALTSWQYEALSVFSYKSLSAKINAIDKEIKKRGYVLSFSQKKEFEKTSFSIVISGRFAIGEEEGKVYIAPFCTLVMDKKFKEWCRIHKIPRHIRGYLFTYPSVLAAFSAYQMKE